MSLSAVTRDGITLRLTEDGYVDHAGLARLLEVKLAYRSSVTSLSECVKTVTPLLAGQAPTKVVDGQTVIHPQVACYMVAGVDNKLRSTLILMTYESRRLDRDNTQARKAAQSVEEITAETCLLKMAEEKTKQVSLQTSAVKDALGLLDSFTVASRPQSVDIIANIVNSLVGP
jgi:hypothetical protein